MNITHLRHVVLTDPDPERLADFYEQVWGLRRAAADDSIYLGGTGPEHHVLVIRPGSEVAVVGYSLALADEHGVDAAADALLQRDETQIVHAAGVLDSPGGGYGFAILDPDGRTIEFSAGVAQIEHRSDPVGGPPLLPSKVAHLVLNTPRFESYREFLVEALGFRVADETEFMVFLKCNLDHHSVALTRAPHPSLNHIAFELPTARDVLSGITHMNSLGYETLWGPGRHPQGMNAFGYFLAPNGQVVEYTAEVEQIRDDDVAPRFWTPDDYEVYDDWADVSSLRPTSDTRELMLGVPEGQNA